jgi:hypothetical protein
MITLSALPIFQHDSMRLTAFFYQENFRAVNHQMRMPTHCPQDLESHSTLLCRPKYRLEKRKRIGLAKDVFDDKQRSDAERLKAF